MQAIHGLSSYFELNINIYLLRLIQWSLLQLTSPLPSFISELQPVNPPEGDGTTPSNVYRTHYVQLLQLVVFPTERSCYIVGEGGGADVKTEGRLSKHRDGCTSPPPPRDLPAAIQKTLERLPELYQFL